MNLVSLSFAFGQSLSFDFLKAGDRFPFSFLHRLSLPVLANALSWSCRVSLSDSTACLTPWHIFQRADTSPCTPVSNAPFPQLVTFQVKNVPTSRKHRPKSLWWSSLLQASESCSSRAPHCNSNEVGYHEEKEIRKTKQDQCKGIDPYFLLQAGNCSKRQIQRHTKEMWWMVSPSISILGRHSMSINMNNLLRNTPSVTQAGNTKYIRIWGKKSSWNILRRPFSLK